MLHQAKRELVFATLIFTGLCLSIGCAGTKTSAAGGQPAINAAVELFYKKVLADKKVNHHFEGINVDKLKERQKQFLTKAFGGPDNYKGRDLRRAHRLLDLKESDFNAIAGHLQATLKELKVDDKLIAEAMAVAASTKDAVLDK